MMSGFKAEVEELFLEPAVQRAYDRQRAIVQVAQAIRSWRHGAGLTQAELAKALGTNQAVISRLESSDGDSLPNIATLVDIAHACNHRLGLGLLDADAAARLDRDEEHADAHQQEMIAL